MVNFHLLWEYNCHAKAYPRERGSGVGFPPNEKHEKSKMFSPDTSYKFESWSFLK